MTLRLPNPFRGAEAPAPLSIEVAGRRVPVELKVSPQARRITLRADATRGLIRLSLPPRSAPARALAMLDTHRDWIAARVAGWPAAAAFEPGARLTVDGVDVTVDWSPGRPRAVILSEASLRVGGPLEGLSGRIERFLKDRAREVLTAETRALAAELGRPVTAVSVRDTASRWGSCTAGGRIAYSWRLILAPPEVRRYVVAHEVAHLAHLDHGADFWRLTASLYGRDVAPARRWLRRHGASLHWVGRS